MRKFTGLIIGASFGIAVGASIFVEAVTRTQSLPSFDTVADVGKTVSVGSSGYLGWSSATGVTGAIVGPTGAVGDNNLVQFNGTGGHTIEDSGVPSANVVLVSRAVQAGTGLTVTNSGLLSADITMSLANGVTRSVLGVTGATGPPTSIASSADDQVLRRTGGVVGFGTVDTGGITNDAITYAKLQNVAALSLVGRASNSSGDAADITGTDGQVCRVSGTTLGFGQIRLDQAAAVTGALVSTSIPAFSGDISNTAGSGALSVTGYTANALDLIYFGDGSDGTLAVTGSVTSGPITAGVLTRDAYFQDLTITSPGSINMAGYRIFVRGTLDISGGGPASITAGGTIGSAGTTSTGGAGAAAYTTGELGTNGAGATGGNSSTTTGAVGSNASALAVAFGGPGATGGRGGTGATTQAGGAGGSGAAVTIQAKARSLITTPFFRGSALVFAGAGGGGGGGGGGSVALVGGGGGGGGAGGAMCAVYARTINRASVGSVISCSGGGGAVGVGATNANSAGGAGGGGGSGGLVYVAYRFLTGTLGASNLSSSGGNGGAGGAGNGTGTGGFGGNGGNGGLIMRYDLGAGTLTVTDCTASAGSAGGSPSGTTAGSSGARFTCTAAM
jgi:hypothetical protein